MKPPVRCAFSWVCRGFEYNVIGWVRTSLLCVPLCSCAGPSAGDGPVLPVPMPLPVTLSRSFTMPTLSPSPSLLAGGASATQQHVSMAVPIVTWPPPVQVSLLRTHTQRRPSVYLLRSSLHLYLWCRILFVCIVQCVNHARGSCSRPCCCCHPCSRPCCCGCW